MRIRRAESGDLAELEALENHFPGDRLSRRQLRHLVTRAHAEAWVAEDDDGQVVGDAVVLYRRGFDSARLHSLVVAPAARGGGLGAALLNEVERSAAERGCVSVRLEVREDNPVAQELYRSRGYAVVGRTDDYYHDGSAALRMRKSLRGKVPDLLGVPYIPQTLPFTCGPACVMMAVRAFGEAQAPTRAEELRLWREATTVFMAAGHGGCSPHGLAVAALRRGHRVRVLSCDGDVPFLDSVRGEEKKAVVELAHREFEVELADRGGDVIVAHFGIEAVDDALAAGEVPILLVSGYRLYDEKVPHWVVVTGMSDSHLYLHDPFVPEGSARADGVHLPLPRESFERVARFGKARHRYLVAIGARKDGGTRLPRRLERRRSPKIPPRGGG